MIDYFSLNIGQIVSKFSPKMVIEPFSALLRDHSLFVYILVMISRKSFFNS